MALSPEEGAVVTGSGLHTCGCGLRCVVGGEELRHEVGQSTDTSPVFHRSVAGRKLAVAHLVVGTTGHQEEGRAPRGGVDAVLHEGEHSFDRCAVRTVVAHEELLVGRPVVLRGGSVELEGRVHHLLGIFFSLCPLCLACVDLGVEVEAGEEQPSRSLVGASVAGFAFLFGFGFGHVRLGFEEFLFNPSVDFSTALLLALTGVHVGAQHHVAPTIHQVVVIKRTEEAHFGRHLCIGAAGHFKIVVAHGHTEEEAIVKTAQHRMTGRPCVVGEGCDAFIAPKAVGFVGRHGLRVDQLAHEARCTAVDAIDIAVAVGTTVARHRHQGIAFIKEVLGSHLHVGARVDGSDIEVVHARRQTEAQRERCSRNERFDI